MALLYIPLSLTLLLLTFTAVKSTTDIPSLSRYSEPISKRSSLATSNLARIRFSASSPAWLFINGRLAAVSRSSEKFVYITRKLQRGDLITIRARAALYKKPAIIADVFYRNRHFATGGPHWKVHPYVAKWQSAWKTRAFSSCRWTRGRNMVLGKRFVRAKGFPYTATGARYVRARKENGLGNVTILRHIVGGEQCPKGLGWKKAIIRFSSNGKSVLFINGRRVAVNVRARKFKTVVRNVRRGDVIAVSVRAQKGPKGVIVDVYHSKTHYPTGRGHWKVHKFVKTWQPKWKFPSFSSCKWERGVRAARVVRAVGFPYKTSRARYVWADPNESGSPNSLILRHVVGGENCVRGNRNRSKIRFSADQRAVLFINGVRIAAIRNPKRYKFVSRSLKRGDVVAIVAQNRGRRGRGVIADVFHGKRHFATGSRSWRAHFFAPRKGRPFRQTQKSFSSCKWNRAVPVAKGTQLVRASRFPYKRTGARYVWAAAGRKQRSVVVIRFVVGGENCSRNEIVQGQNNGKRTCKCRRSNGRNGICWEMINPTGTGNRCRSRVCDVKYECVGSRLAGSKICIRRIATEKVVPTGTPGICTKEDTNSVFYVPYE